MNATAELTIGELDERAHNVEDFDDEAVTARILSFTEEDLNELSKHRGLVTTLVDDLRGLQKEMTEELVDRDVAIELALACFIAHLNMVFLGPPGTAKSLVVRRLSYGLGLQSRPVTVEELNRSIQDILQLLKSASGDDPDVDGTVDPESDSGRRYYEVLLTRYSTSDEILGPANLQLMIRRAMFFRQTTGLLPEADVAFLDEIWKANSAILNALLSISNEKIFYNAGQPVRVPLCMIFGASNEVPREEELWAMYDRFPIRVMCEPVDNSRLLLKKAADQARRSLFAENGSEGGKRKAVQRLATVNHFRLLFRALYGHFGPESSLEGFDPDSAQNSDHKFARAFCDTFDALKREFQISDRSLHSLYRLALALALLRGNPRPESTELDVFKYCFYEPETAPALCDAVDQRISRYGSLN